MTYHRLSLEYASLLMDKEIMETGDALYLETQKHQEAIQENKDVEISSNSWMSPEIAF